MTAHQLIAMRGRSLWKCFLEADKFFEERGYPCTLAICAEGIDSQPEWVAHIKANLDRYKLQLHCFEHKNFKHLSYEEALYDLAKAKFAIETTFGVSPTMWYPPWGRKGTPSFGHDVCQALGIQLYNQRGRVDAKFWLDKPEKYPHVNFHYWCDHQVEHVREILKRLYVTNT